MSDNQQLLQPDPALRRLDRLVGTWTTPAFPYLSAPQPAELPPLADYFRSPQGSSR
jgi:hypothetical protein